LPLFLNRNFGCVSKEEIELIVFKHFIKATKNTGISDYDISKKLGLTLIKVKNLKVKNYLRFEDAYDLKSKFSKIIDNTAIIAMPVNIVPAMVNTQVCKARITTLAHIIMQDQI